METAISGAGYKNRSKILLAIGVLLLLAGIAISFLGPIEMSVFYLFEDSGRFHYDGFGFGSFMFGNIASQIIGYYLIGTTFIILGYGHLRMRRWVRTLSVALLWVWLVIGLPLIGVVFFILVASKDLSLPAALSALALLGLSYFVLPGLLIRFYQGENVRRTFAARDAGVSVIDTLPIPILVLGLLYGFYLITLHILILFNGIFPVFGVFRFGLTGIVLIDLSIACLVLILWGTLRQRLWAWWGSVLWFGLFTISTVLSSARYHYLDLLTGLAFPPQEIDILDGIPAQGYHFSILAGTPLLLTWVIAVLSKRHFRTGV